jgi:predicted CXXCH cytochrome family protein
MLKHTKNTMLILLTMSMSTLTWAVDKPTTAQTTCVTAECHGDYKAMPFVHGPVGLGECKSCHEAADATKHTYTLARSGRDLCEYCHLDQAAKLHVHDPLKKGDCLQCHDPHSSEGKFLIKGKTVAGLCKTCHDVTKGDTHLHGPTAVGECSICHNAHSSDYKNLLTVEPNDLCFSCHVDTKKEISKFAFVHEPAKGDCVGCHDPHGANSFKLLKTEAPELCVSCHTDIKALAENSPFKHSVVMQKDGCLSCHTPHASTVKFLMKDEPATLCLSCHDKPVGVDQNNVLPAFTEQIENKKFLHGPVKDNTCSGCHMAHGSDHFRLLAQTYPAEFYAPYSKENYALCFGCHEEDVAETERTTELTDFRNGNLNLHYLHVNKDKRGRTCRACHQTHASNQPRHLRENVPYGMWNLPVGFTKTDTGGSCEAGCHASQDYDRNKPVEYLSIAKKTN